jgi:hypothetical protein
MNFWRSFKTNSGISLEYHLGLGDLYDEGKHRTEFGNFQLDLICKLCRFILKTLPVLL